MVPQGKTETVQTYRRRIYDTILILMNTEEKNPQHAHRTALADYRMAKNVEESVHSPSHRLNEDNMVQDIHDIVPTQARIHKIRIAPTENCRLCDRKHTLLQRLVECGDGRYQWEWTKERLAIMLRTGPRWIPEEWLLLPHITLWHPQRQRAVLWVLAQSVGFRSQLERNLTFQDYIDFLRRSKYKFYAKRNRITQVGNYLSILEIHQG